MHHPLSLTMPLAQLRPTTQAAPTPAPAPAPAAPAAPAVTVTNTPTAAQSAPAGTQTAAGTLQSGTPATEEAAKPHSLFDSIGGILPIVLMFVLLYFIMFRGQRKTEKNRKQMIANMKKGDEVMTIGGLVGRIVSLDDDEVVLKIDESANVKARYKKSAIQQVLTGEEKTK